MAKASPIISAMNAGEWSPLLSGRVDLAGYSASAYRCENFIPLVQGPITRRGGTVFVRKAKGTGQAWLVPFVKSRSDSWQIEFGSGYCRFYTDRAPVLTGSPKTITGATAADPVVITSTAHGFSNGDDVYISGVAGMTQLNGRWFIAANVAANTFELTTVHGDDVDGTGYDAYTSGGEADEPYEIVSPFTTLETDNGEFAVDMVQTGNFLYLTDRAGAVAPQRLERSAATSWAFTAINPDVGPFDDLNATATSMYVSAVTGSGITITASSSVFTAADVGRLIRIDQEELTASNAWVTNKAYVIGNTVRSEGHEYEATTNGTSGTTIPAHTSGSATDGVVTWLYRSSGYGVARITAQGGTTATADVVSRFPITVLGSGNVSTLWRKGAWYTGNYPTCLTLWRERLALGLGQRVDLSVSGSYEDFSPDKFGQVLPESAVAALTPGGMANEVVGLGEGKALLVFTEGGELAVDSQSSSEPFGPNNIRLSGETAYGSRPVRPIRIGQNTLMVQSSGQRVRSVQYSFEADSFIAPDMTVRSDHLVKPAVVAMARQESPYQTIWFSRSDGVLLSFAFDQTQEVRGWARHLIAGADAVVESVSVSPSPDGRRDDVWMIVSRTINGATRRYIEYMSPEYETGDSRNTVCYADSALLYSGASVSGLVGYDHLEGETIGLMVDGSAAPDVVVTNGEITLASAGTAVQAGLRFASVYATQTIESGAADGTSQAKTKRLTDVSFRMIDSLGGQAGPDLANLDDVPDLTYRAPATPMDTSPGFFTGDALVSWPGGYETAGRIWYSNDTMFPATIAAIMPQVQTQEGR